MDHGMQEVGELRQLTALDLSMVFNATGVGRKPEFAPVMSSGLVRVCEDVS